MENAFINPKITCLSNVPEEKTEWLADGFIPKGQITLLLGKRGVGKAEFWCRTAAAVSAGDPGCFPKLKNLLVCKEPRKVLFLAADKSVGRDILPALNKANANLANIFTVDVLDESFEYLAVDIGEAVIQLIEKIRPGLFVIEPYSFFISQNPGFLWRSLEPFVEAIRKYNTVALFVGKQTGEEEYISDSNSGYPDMRDIAGSVLLLESDQFGAGKTLYQLKNPVPRKSSIQII